MTHYKTTKLGFPFSFDNKNIIKVVKLQNITSPTEKYVVICFEIFLQIH